MEYIKGEKLDFTIDSLKKRWAKFEVQNPKIDLPYQEIGIEMECYFQRKIWFLFYKDGYTLNRIKYAFNETRKQGKK